MKWYWNKKQSVWIFAIAVLINIKNLSEYHVVDANKQTFRLLTVERLLPNVTELSVLSLKQTVSDIVQPQN